MPVTFQVVGNLADFGNDPIAGVKIRAYATPAIKVSESAVHSNQPEQVVTDDQGAFALTLVSLPGVWYKIQSTYSGALRPVNLAGYIPDVTDPTTGIPLPDGTVINLRTVADEDPTPGYEAISYMGPAGPAGDKGDTGDTGAQGVKGDKGDTGERGPGIASDEIVAIDVLTQATYDALVTKSPTTLYLIQG